MTFCSSTSYRDFHTDQTFHQSYYLHTEYSSSHFYRIASGFHGAFVTVVVCQQGTLTLPDTWFRPFLGLAYAPIFEISFLKLDVILPTFHLEYPLVLPRFCFDKTQNIFTLISLLHQNLPLAAVAILCSFVRDEDHFKWRCSDIECWLNFCIGDTDVQIRLYHEYQGI